MLINCRFEYDLILMYTNAIINYMYFLYRHASIKPIHFLILFFNVRSIQYDYLFPYICIRSNLVFVNEINDFWGIIGEGGLGSSR